MTNSYIGRGRPPKEKIPDFALDEIKKFFDGYKSLRIAAEILGVSNTTAWSWYHGKFRPKEKFVNKMIKLSGGSISKSKVMQTSNGFKEDYKTLKNYIKTVHIKPKAKIMGITVDEYYDDYTHPNVKRAIDKDSLNEVDIPLLHAFYGNSLDYWVKIAKSFN